MNKEILNINFYKQNIKLVDNLTLEEMKSRYGWILNASIENAIIGQTKDKRLIWYSGTWKDGIWKNGIWCSGIWENGEWWNGVLNSLEFSEYELLNYVKDDDETDTPLIDIINKKKNINSSLFKKGVWVNGRFEYGHFGIENTYDTTNQIYNTKIPNKDKTLIEDLTWENGIFNNGIMVNCLWKNGEFKRGCFLNSIWENGIFEEGKLYNSIWENGDWKGGDFIKGEWFNGNFQQTKKDRLSRFGFTDITNDTQCIWFDGNFYSGEWFCGYDKEEQYIIPSKNNEVSIWYDGNFNDGTWYGGMFMSGKWKNGIWKNGIFGVYSSVFYISNYLQGTNWEDDLEGVKFDTNMETSGTINNDIKTLITDDLLSKDFNINEHFIKSMSKNLTNIELVIKEEGFFNTATNMSSGSFLNKINSKDYNIKISLLDNDSVSLLSKDVVKNGKIQTDVIYNGNNEPITDDVDLHGKSKYVSYNINLKNDLISISDVLENIRELDIIYNGEMNLPLNLVGKSFNQKINIKEIKIKFYFESEQTNFEDTDVTDTQIIDKINKMRGDLVRKSPEWFNGVWEDGTAVNATLNQNETLFGYCINCNFTKK